MKPTLFCESFRAVLWVVLSLLLAACGRALPANVPTPTFEASPTTSPAATPTATPEPSPTPLPPLALLVVPPGADPRLADELHEALSEPIGSAGLRWERRPGLTPADLVDGLSLAVVLPPDSGVAAWATAAPSTQFLAIGIPGLSTAPNLSVVGELGTRYDQAGFMAGFLATLVTDDWRVGVVSVADTPSGKAAGRGFVNGSIFFCGLCRPSFPPFYQYPVLVELPSGSSALEQQAAIQFLSDRNVQTAYIFPGAWDESMASLLSQTDIRLLGEGLPDSSLHSQWIASIRPDPIPGVLQALPDLLRGQGGLSLPMPLTIQEINQRHLSPGRQELAARILEDLLAGYIDTGVDPLTGEER